MHFPAAVRPEAAGIVKHRTRREQTERQRKGQPIDDRFNPLVLITYSLRRQNFCFIHLIG